jgi:hypothetical protein
MITKKLAVFRVLPLEKRRRRRRRKRREQYRRAKPSTALAAKIGEPRHRNRATILLAAFATTPAVLLLLFISFRLRMLIHPHRLAYRLI